MKSKDIYIGEVYEAKVSGQLVPVRITGTRETVRGTTLCQSWQGVNEKTNHRIAIRSCQRLRRNITIERLFRRDGDLRNLGRKISAGDDESIRRGIFLRDRDQNRQTTLQPSTDRPTGQE